MMKSILIGLAIFLVVGWLGTVLFADHNNHSSSTESLGVLNTAGGRMDQNNASTSGVTDDSLRGLRNTVASAAWTNAHPNGVVDAATIINTDTAFSFEYTDVSPDGIAGRYKITFLFKSGSTDLISLTDSAPW